KKPYQYRSSSRKTGPMKRRSAGVFPFDCDRLTGKNKTTAMIIKMPATTKASISEFIASSPPIYQLQIANIGPCFYTSASIHEVGFSQSGSDHCCFQPIALERPATNEADYPIEQHRPSEQ